MRFSEAAEYAKNGSVIVSNGCRVIYVGDAMFSSPQHNISGVLAAQYMRIATAVESTVFYPFTPSSVDLSHNNWAVEDREVGAAKDGQWGAVIVRVAKQLFHDAQAVLLGSDAVRILAAADTRDGFVEFTLEHKELPQVANGRSTPRGFLLVERDEILGNNCTALVIGEQKYSL